MEIILMQDLSHAGKRGEVIHVKPGYARNYLIPQGLALEATAANRRLFEQRRVRIDAEHAREREGAEGLRERIMAAEVVIAKRVGEHDTLYGSVTASEIAEALEAQGIEVDKRRIDLEGGIKTLGEHPVRIDLHSEVAAELLVKVVAEE
ncbi:MAG: 50S ribosomal protein L9 [Thermoanaerobaculia bacterium]